VTFFGKTLKLGPGTEVSRIRDFETWKKEDFLFKIFISNISLKPKANNIIWNSFIAQ
jgi:hypothetical protein